MEVCCDWRCTGTQMTTRYQLVTENKNWTDAQMYCQNELSAKLVVLDDFNEHHTLQQYIETTFSGLVCLASLVMTSLYWSTQKHFRFNPLTARPEKI